MKELIKSECERLHISDFGVAEAEIYEELGAFLEKTGKVPMTPEDIRERIDPFLIMPEARSILVCLMSYFTGYEEGNLSKYARGEDYHRVMGCALSQLENIFREHGFKAVSFCDTGNLNDRYLAYKAGLGFFGKNGFLIHPRYGTYTVIGYIITDCELSPSKPLDTKCADCGACSIECPGGAIDRNGSFDYKKCVSYITQKKGELSEEEKNAVKNSGYLWGCDVCQDVCPHNIYADKTDIQEFNEYLCNNLHIDEGVSNRGFIKMHKNKAYTWRGKSVIIRNQRILEKKGK